MDARDVIASARFVAARDMQRSAHAYISLRMHEIRIKIYIHACARVRACATRVRAYIVRIA
jgi:ribosomal protein L16/L10AE